ncbi:MAG: hypothetical protein BA869_04900 [Desulfuromonadales bacterium C00003107]|nr:MAG: hypothetical protein BA869_04900 [Desulfuromonadales bacterium C00003107]
MLTPEILQNNKKAQACFGDLNRLVADCGDLLRRYVEWWCLGNELKGQETKVTWGAPDSDEDGPDSEEEAFFQLNMEEDEEDLFLFATEPEEKELFLSILPYLIFALAVSRKCGANYETVFSIVAHQPRGPIDLYAPDLWIQRRAVLACYGLAGIDPFVPYNPSIRSILLYFLALALVRALPETEIRRVAETMVVDEPPDDNFHWVRDWLQSN